MGVDLCGPVGGLLVAGLDARFGWTRTLPLRGHTVVDAGPYRAVRHPGYVGWIVSALAAPLLLGSVWALVPAALGSCVMVARTALEDRTLRRELPGYEDYATRVRSRLLPWVW
jgi:protein-S-isoprenylcysteine O-methyltransferase Ste14